jgi:hypothetical protein
MSEQVLRQLLNENTRMVKPIKDIGIARIKHLDFMLVGR